MTKEKQLIAIAEACGFSDVRMANEPSTLLTGIPMEKAHPKHRELIPDYPNDLNAMHEAEKELDKSIWVEDICLKDAYADEIMALFAGGPDNPNLWNSFDIVTVSAEKRAEAFLKTIGKWKDNEDT